jgi:hypothetical protein
MAEHFEQLWNESEVVALKQYLNKETAAVLAELADIVREFGENNVPMPDLGQNDLAELRSSLLPPLRKRQIGLMLYLISLLSARTDTNVFAALKEEVDVNRMVSGG